jgi:prepilin-type processing-associated H-X9-DG protein
MKLVHSENPSARGFTLVELLVSVSTVALLLSVLVPSLRGAREQARAAVCGSNVRQVTLANTAYAADHGGRYCPGAAGLRSDNLHRWHGIRDASDEPFDADRGPLVVYLGGQARIRVCPSFRSAVRDSPAAFERGCGGYGYNQAYIGRVVRGKTNGSCAVITDRSGVSSERIQRPAGTLMFADAAFAAVAEGVVEYSFAEPRFHAEYVHRRARTDPSVHFRHGERASVAWADGHVSRPRRSFTWDSGLYAGDPERARIGWFGHRDDNSDFDLR